MTTALQTQSWENKLDLVKSTLGTNVTNEEFELFIYQAKRTGLDPLSKQIYAISRWTKNGSRMSVQTGIDGFRVIAARSGLYAGSSEPLFEEQDGLPTKCTITVKKLMGAHLAEFTSSAYWAEYCPKPPQDTMWKKMPHVMLAKCAEAQALRKAFPADLSGLYVTEEMEQVDEIAKTIDAPIKDKRVETKLPLLDTPSGPIYEGQGNSFISKALGPKDNPAAGTGRTITDNQIRFWKTKTKVLDDGFYEKIKSTFGVESITELNNGQFQNALTMADEELLKHFGRPAK